MDLVLSVAESLAVFRLGVGRDDLAPATIERCRGRPPVGETVDERAVRSAAGDRISAPVFVKA